MRNPLRGALALMLLEGVSVLAGARPIMAQTAPVSTMADVVQKTANGSTYTLPAGWRSSVSGGATILTPEESDLRIAVFEGIRAADAKAAAVAAWAAFRPHGAPPFKLATARAARNGWDEQMVIDYETSPSEHRIVQASARRKSDGWTVLIIDGSEGTFEKRQAAVTQIATSLRPKGFERENFLGRTAHPLDPARVSALLDFVRAGASGLDVPGVGIALYSGGRIVYEGGVGVREAGKPGRVDAHTRFMIASNTKSFATLLLAQLVGEGKLAWDDPVTKVYPAFRLGDDQTTRQVRIRHLVCACTGLPRKDMEWLFTIKEDTPASSTFDLLAATQPTSRFGETFQYNNLMAAAAGYVAAHLYYPDMELGAAFDRAVKEHITDPLGMKDTTSSMNTALAGDHATPHGLGIDDRLAILSQDLNRTVAPLRPAGGLWSSPHDMILYMRNELDEGRLPDGRQLVSRKALLERRARGISVGEDQWYGMGLEENARWGVPVIHHGGDLSGYHSDMIAIPSAGVAAVILTNGDNGYVLRGPFLRRLLEILYDGRPEAQGDLEAAIARDKAEMAELRSKLTVPGDAQILDGLARRYTNADLGPISIEGTGAGARLIATPWSSAVVTRKNIDGTSSLIASDPALLGLEFVIGSKDGKRTLTLRDAQHIYVFTE